jgi:Phage Single-stranded DNA-binding protein
MEVWRVNDKDTPSTVPALLSSIVPTDERLQTYSSLDAKKPEDVLLLFKARQGSDKTLKDKINESLTVKHLLKHRIPDVDETTGEVSEWTRWCLITDDNLIVSTGSAPVEGDILTLISVLGPPPWEPGPIVIPRIRQSKRNPQHTYIQLELDEKRLVQLLEIRIKGGKRK